MPNLLLLTVGTGTAGKTSNLAEGLRRTVVLLNPRRFWLAPSTAPDSHAMADLVREDLPSFTPRAGDVPYFMIANPDDLERCRRELRNAIAAIRRELQPGERLIVNPTSGTKQMTAAAVLAALDEGIGDIVFTTGQRADGVVVTGTETITPFDPSAFLREHDFATARALFSAGAFSSAALVLSSHAGRLPRARSLCNVLHHWRRFAYTDAVAAATGHWETLRSVLAQRAQHAATGKPSLEIMADALAWADHASRLGDATECLSLAYKALELSARYALITDLSLATPLRNGRYQLERVRAIAKSRETDSRLVHLARNSEVALGLLLAMQLLDENAHPLGRAFSDDKRLVSLTSVRNESVHDIRPAETSEALSLLDRARNLVASSFPNMRHTDIPRELPES